MARPNGPGCRPSDQTPSGSGGKAASIPRAAANPSDDDIYERAIARANERIQAEIEREGYPPSAQYLAAIGVSEGLRLASIAASVREGEHKQALLEAQHRVRESDLYAIEGLMPVQQPHHIGPGWGHYVQALREAVDVVRAAPFRRGQ